jgi:hypothetical protein
VSRISTGEQGGGVRDAEGWVRCGVSGDHQHSGQRFAAGAFEF